MFNGLKISATGMLSERVRLEAISSNLANANNTSVDANGEIYRRKQVLLGEDNLNFEGVLNGVKVTNVIEDSASDKLVYDPSHADAIKEGEYAGYVRYPNVDIAKEMIDLINAQRAFEVNSQTFSASKSLLDSSINIMK